MIGTEKGRRGTRFPPAKKYNPGDRRGNRQMAPDRVRRGGKRRGGNSACSKEKEKKSLTESQQIRAQGIPKGRTAKRRGSGLLRGRERPERTAGDHCREIGFEIPVRIRKGKKRRRERLQQHQGREKKRLASKSIGGKKRHRRSRSQKKTEPPGADVPPAYAEKKSERSKKGPEKTHTV